MLKNTPLSKQRIVMQKYDTDYVHEASTTNSAIDQQDQIRLDIPGALRQGLMQHRNALSYGWVDGARAYDRTARGLRSATHKQVQRSETIRR